MNAYMVPTALKAKWKTPSLPLRTKGSIIKQKQKQNLHGSLPRVNSEEGQANCKMQGMTEKRECFCRGRAIHGLGVVLLSLLRNRYFLKAEFVFRSWEDTKFKGQKTSYTVSSFSYSSHRLWFRLCLR